MVAHGISTGALFIIAGTLHERIQTRDLGQMGGLWAKIPKMGALGLVFVMASLGFPGLGNFVAEFLILNGSFMANQKLTIIATLGLVAATIYALRIMQKVFYGKEQKTWVIADFSIREMGIMITLVIAVVWMGLFPSAVLTVSRPSVLKVIESVADRKAQTREAQLHRQTTLEQKITMTGASLPGHHWNTNSKKAN